MLFKQVISWGLILMMTYTLGLFFVGVTQYCFSKLGLGSQSFTIPGKWSTIPLTKEWHDQLGDEYGIDSNQSYRLRIKDSGEIILTALP